MATPPNLLQFAFAAGLDESQQAEILDPLKGFTLLENGRQDKRGGYTKRLGFDAQTRARLDATTRTTGNRLLSHKDLICTIDGTYLDTYAETQSISAVASRVPEASVTSRTLSSEGDSLLDVAQCNGYLVNATLRVLDGTARVVAAVETEAGVVVRAPETVFDTGGADGGASFGTYSTYVLLLIVGDGLNVTGYYLDTASSATLSAGWQSMGSLATDRQAVLGGQWVISVQSLTDRVAFAYVNTGGGASRVTVKTVNISGALESVNVNTSSVQPNFVAVEGSIADTLWIAWNETTAIKLQGRDADSLSTTLATTATIITVNTAPNRAPYIVSSSTAGRGRLAVDDGDGDNFQLRNFQTSAGAAATDGAQTTVRGLRMDARPFLLGGRYYGLFRSGDASNGISVLCDWTDMTTSTTRWARPVAVAFPGLTDAMAHRSLHPILFSGTRAAYAMPIRRSAHSIVAELVTYDFADRKRWRSAAHNGSLCLSGGILSYFDGRRVAEVSFLHAPETPSASDAGTGSGPDGDYRYVATFEETDDDGNWCISGVSLPTEVVSVADNSVNLSMAPLTITNRLTASPLTIDKRVRVAFYRTLDGGEAPYYYVGSSDNWTSISATLTDSLADEDLRQNRLLYGTGNLPATNGAAQDRRAPPFCQDVTSYNGMLVVASGSDLWWSGQTIGGEGTWFSPAFSLTVEGDGNVTALAAQDGTLYVFKRRGVFAVAGEPPSDNGAVGGLGSPRKLAVDVGCIDPCSVVVTSLGIFFQSERGIELLNRGGAVVWVGESVQDTLASYPIVSSAVLDPRHGLVRFTLAESEETGRVDGDGRSLVFDLTLGAWISRDNIVSGEPGQDAAVVYLDGVWRYAFLTTSGIVYVERLASDPAAHLDDTSGIWITMAAETAWFKTSGLQGKQQLSSVLLLARKHTDHNVKLSLAYNYEETFRTAQEWSYATINALLDGGWPVTQLKHGPHNDAPCQAVRIRIEDESAAGGEGGGGGDTASGKGATWLGLTLDITPKPGVFDVPEEAA